MSCSKCYPYAGCDECTCAVARFPEEAARRLATPPFSLKRGVIYLIGSMRNPRVPEIAQLLRGLGFEVFDDWFSSGPESDDRWQAYEKARGRTFREALDGYHARHVFELDKYHLDRCNAALMVMPAGKSGHLELGAVIGAHKPGFILLDGEPERFDIMYRFATDVFTSTTEMLGVLDQVLV